MQNKINTFKILSAVAIYAVAMALAEAVVVVYLRELYYPSGFFIKSLQDIIILPKRILVVEQWREAATIIMLGSVAFLSFKELKRKLWAFVFAFSVWVVFYYLFLYIILGWPSSFSTLDIYFLIPKPWIGPVWLPLLLFSLLMVISFRFILKTKQRES